MILFIIIVAVAIGAFLFGLGIGSSNKLRQHYTDPVVDEMRMQRARDYINNPVVQELKSEASLRQQTPYKSPRY